MDLREINLPSHTCLIYNGQQKCNNEKLTKYILFVTKLRTDIHKKYIPEVDTFTEYGFRKYASSDSELFSVNV